MKSFGQAVLWMAVFLTPAWAQIPFTVQPLGGINNVDWSITNYVDVDPTNGWQDYTGAAGDVVFSYNGHDAIDFALPNFAAMDRGVPVYAVADGTVSFVEDRQYDRCSNNCSVDKYNGIRITHSNGFETGYYHLARNSALVNDGDTVVAGQQIGLVGSAGNSSDPHLHFVVKSNGFPIETYLSPAIFWSNPLPYAGDGVRVIDNGFTRLDQDFPQLRDRPSNNDVIFQSDGQNQQIRFWSQIHSLEASDVVVYQLTDPNGASQIISQPHARMNWGWLEQNFTLPSTPATGVWELEMRINGIHARTDDFTVVAAPQTRTWANTLGGSYWSSTANWGGGVVPGAGDDVSIAPSDGITRSIIYDSAGPTLKSLVLDLTGPGSGYTTFYNEGNDIALIDTLTVGDQGRGWFRQFGGRVTTANPALDVNIGVNGFSAGFYEMHSTANSNAALHVARNLVLGGAILAQGTFNQNSGTTTTVGHTDVAHAFGSYGTYNLSGGTLNVGGILYVGNGGQGVLTVTGSSQLITNTGTRIGYGPLSHGTMTIDGARTFWDRVPGSDSTVVVGHEGTGTLNIRNGATVNTGSVILGEFASGTGTVNVSGSTQWNTRLIVGEAGIGNLNITENARVETDSTLTIGDLTGSHGTVVVDGHSNGHNSVLITEADMWVGYQGSGRVTVSNDASLHAHSLRIGVVTGVGRLSVLSGGDVFVSDTTYLGLLGTLDGDSYISSNIRNNGVVYPSTSPTDPGTLTVSGSYTQEASGLLRISLASDSDFSQLSTVPLGSLMLNGTLYVDTINGFSPFQGEVFQILNSNNISGTFSFLQLPALSSGLYWYTNDLYTTGTIRVAGNGVDGDFTSDGYVDNRDYIVWRKGKGSQAHYSQWRANFGRESTGAGSSVSVPEPAAATLFIGALMAAMVRIRSSRSKSRC